MSVTWLGAVVIGILVLMGAAGYRRGFIKEIVSFFFVFLAMAAAWAINPYVNDFLVNNTPVCEKIQESCDSLVKTRSDSGEPAAEGEEAPGESDSQTSYIDGLGLPGLLSQNLKENNTSEAYSLLAVNTLQEYVSDSLASMIVNGISYLISWILATIVIRIAYHILNLIASLPVIRVVNRMAGGLVGIAKGVLFAWIGLLVLTVLCNTEIGQTGLNLVDQDVILKTLYQYDIFVKFLMNIF